MKTFRIIARPWILLRRWRGTSFLLSSLCIWHASSAQSSLQQRIDAANPGDTLIVSAGVCSGNILIHKRLVLLGERGATIHGNGDNSIVTITADSCVVSGFFVEHGGSMLMNEDAGILVKSRGNRIEGNSLRDVLFGIYLLRAHGNTVRGNAIIGKHELDIGERGSGIHVFDSYGNRLIANTISYTRDGFYIQNAHHTWIEGNSVSHLRYGLHYMYADSNTFLHNTFVDNVAGAAIMYSRGIVMRGNRFIRNRGFSSYGILFQDCHGMVADSNVVADNVVGMFFEASTDNQFRHNVVAKNDVALQMFANSPGNLFTENNFIDNLSPLTIVGKATGSVWLDRGRGNYWSTYEGYDLDEDGIGDVPMKIQNVFNYLEGRQPNLRLYLYSPASQALAAATTAFPIIDVNHETDTRPLMRPVDLRALIRSSPATPETRPGLLPRNAGVIGITLIAGWALSIAFLRQRGRRRT